MSEQHTYEVKGYKFTIWAEPNKEGFFGRCQCLTCSDINSSNHVDPTEERALNVAKGLAFTHVSVAHKDNG